MALKGSEVCGVSLFLLKAATFKKVFSMSPVRSASGQVQGRPVKFVQLGNPMEQSDRGVDGNVAVKFKQRQLIRRFGGRDV